MANFELTVQPFVVPAPIKWNFETLKTEIGNALKSYESTTYDESSITLAKSDRAKLNSLKNGLNEEKKRIKNQLLEPYMPFENQIKQLMEMVDNASTGIDTQVKAFEDKKQQEKWDILKSAWETIAGDWVNLIPLEKVVNPKWANSGESLKSLQAELKLKCEEIDKSTLTISKFNGEFYDQCFDKYIQTLDLNVALAENTRLEEQKKQRLEMEARKQEQKQQVVQQPQTVTVAKTEPVDPWKELQSFDMRICTTPQKMEWLMQVMNENNIKFEKVGK
jgi:hypothetical protein